MDELAIERVLKILRPDSAHRTDCLRDATEVVRWIEGLMYLPAKRQLASDAKKLIAAQEVLEQLGGFFMDAKKKEEIAFELGQLGELLGYIADHVVVGNSGRHRSAAYQQKHSAAQLAFFLSLRWSLRPTLTEGGDYFELTAALYEAATGEEAGEVVTACTKVLCDAKADGYDPHKPGPYLQRLTAQIPF
jgi:hypothetical protein